MKIKLNLGLFILVALLVSTSGCDFTKKCYDCFTPPSPIRLKIVNSEGDNLISSGIFNKDSIKLFYFDNLQMKSVPFNVITYQDIIVSSDMAWLSVDKQRDFYLYLNHLDTDTLSLEIVKHSDDCCTWHPIKSFLINGKQAEMSNTDYTFLIRKSIAQ